MDKERMDVFCIRDPRLCNKGYEFLRGQGRVGFAYNRITHDNNTT